MAKYLVNKAAVAHCRKMIDAHQYVVSSDWGDAQPSADEQNEFLETHSWDDYSAWHLGLTADANDETKGRYAFVYGDLRRSTGRASSPACTEPPSGTTRRSSWPPTSCSSTSTRPARRSGPPGTT